MNSKTCLIATCLLWIIIHVPSLAVSGPAYVRDYFDHADEPMAEEQLQMIDEAHTRKAIRWMRENRYNDALGDLRFTLNHWPNHPQALMILVAVSQLLESPGIPKVFFEKALTLYPQHALTHAQYGKFLSDIGEMKSGIERLKYAVSMDPALISGYVWLSEAYAVKGDKASASEAMEQAKKLGYKSELSGDSREKQ